MYGHYILLSSSYKLGQRIAADFIFVQSLEVGTILNAFDRIHEECGDDVLLSTHSLSTDSETWESVVEKDPFFEGIKICDLDQFIKIIKDDRILTGVDVAKYILSRVKCTHLKLQKLTYLAYADYLCKTGKKLFDSSVYAFKYGPVIGDVYEKYKQYGSTEIDDAKIIDSLDSLKMPAMSRVMFSTQGVNKKDSIEDTLAQYARLSATQLVELTHKADTPWEKTYQGTSYKTISDSCIRQFHCNEIVLDQ